MLELLLTVWRTEIDKETPLSSRCFGFHFANLCIAHCQTHTMPNANPVLGNTWGVEHSLVLEIC